MSLRLNYTRLFWDTKTNLGLFYVCGFDWQRCNYSEAYTLITLRFSISSCMVA